MYKLFIKPVLFLFSPESVHQFVVRVLKIFLGPKWLVSVIRSIYQIRSHTLEQELFGIKFPNPVGLAAGFDKDAELTDQLSVFGFGFIEIGTLTPQPQPGNDKPRLFRLPEDKALINRMGFNNDGVSRAVERLKKRQDPVIVGGNIGKNKVTPNETAFEDYESCINELYDVVDYFVVNVSSPNTPDLRQLQEKEPLHELLTRLKSNLNKRPKPKPLLLKIAPDLEEQQLNDILDTVRETMIDGIIATNTTISRSGLRTENQLVRDIGTGGLSGEPLKERSTEIIRYIRNYLGNEFPIIGVGGIASPTDALEKLNAGANLIQVYTGFIYEGPSIVNKINKGLLKCDWKR